MTTLTQLRSAVDHLHQALSSYSAAIGPRMDTEVHWVGSALADLQFLLAGKLRKSAGIERLAQTARAVVVEAERVVVAHGPEKVRQSLESQARRVRRACGAEQGA